MIVDRAESHFIFIFPEDQVHGSYQYIQYDGRPLTNRDYLKYWGKWLVFGTREALDVLARELSPLVDAHKIPAVKYDREIIPAFELGECVMCVYCDARQKEAVWTILSAMGIRDRAWVYEKETMERWLPGGHLLEKWIKGHNLTPVQADDAREGAKQRFKDMFGNENALFRGVEQ
jgi:hypothetical protein